LGLANVLQCIFAQNIGIAFASFDKCDELRGDRLFDVVVAVSSPQSDVPTAFGYVFGSTAQRKLGPSGGP
jgi:hypothetical protein